MAELVHHQGMVRIATEIFRALETPADEAACVAENLVTSSLMGHDSHGVLRIPEYVDQVRERKIVPGAEITVARRSGAAAIVDCGLAFGAVGAGRAMDVCIEIARESGAACAVTRRCGHAGRLGAYPQMAAERDLIALAFCDSPAYGHFVLPWGGREGRLSTNPIAYAVPTGRRPILADFSTSVAPEGKIRWYRNEGRDLPPGWIVDADGKPATDPRAFYGPPRGGILPLGGAAGYKGFALGLLVEVLGSVLGGIGVTDEAALGNGLGFVVLDPSAFQPIEDFKALMDGMVAYVKSSPPLAGFREVQVPGEPEFLTLEHRMREGIPVDAATWERIASEGRELGVDVEELSR